MVSVLSLKDSLIVDKVKVSLSTCPTITSTTTNTSNDIVIDSSQNECHPVNCQCVDVAQKVEVKVVVSSSSYHCQLQNIATTTLKQNFAKRKLFLK